MNFIYDNSIEIRNSLNQWIITNYPVAYLIISEIQLEKEKCLSII